MSRAPNYEFQEWWNKQRDNHLGSSSSYENKSQNPNHTHLTLEISNPTHDQILEKERTRSARQLSWLYILKFQQIAHSFAYLTNAFISILATAKRRLSSNQSGDVGPESKRIYRVIKFFLVIVVVLLVFELLAYFKGWHFSPPLVKSEVEDLVEHVYAKWLEIRAVYLGPMLQSLINVCIVLFLVQSVDRMVMVLGCFWIKFRGIKPVAEIEYLDDGENVNVEDYPMVLVQIPMCNEREVILCRF